MAKLIGGGVFGGFGAPHSIFVLWCRRVVVLQPLRLSRRGRTLRGVYCARCTKFVQSHTQGRWVGIFSAPDASSGHV